MFYQTETARSRAAQSHHPRHRRNGSVCFCMTLFAASALQCIFNGEEICPGDLDLSPLTLTFKLTRAKDQTRLPCEFGANPLSGSYHPLSNASPEN